MAQKVYKSPLEQVESMKTSNSYKVPRQALIYEGDEDVDLPWLINRYNVNIKYDGDSSGTYTISGEDNDLDRFYKEHNLDAFGVKR